LLCRKEINDMSHRSKRGTTSSLEVGQPFNPFGLFNGIWIPEVLVKAKGISAGAKIIYGRLARYAGPIGNCYPSVPTLAAQVAMSVRQTQKYLAELVAFELVRRVPRVFDSGQTSNSYVFLWHPIFALAVNEASPGGVTDAAPEGVNDRSPKESQIEESQSEESHNIDLDYRSANRENRDSRPDVGAAASPGKQYPRLQEALADYMFTADDGGRVYPPARLVVDVMDAAGGATEEQVVRCLHYLRDERGLQPGTRHGPRSFGWFKSVVADYFQQKHNREMIYAPPEADWDLRNGPGLSQQDLDSMTDAIDVSGFQT
jgi:hypothetical protein